MVPEINSGALKGHNGIIANPNCVAIVAATPLWPLHQKKRIARITMSTYQAASGAGAAAMEELSESTKAFLEGRPFTPKVLPHPYPSTSSRTTPGGSGNRYNEEKPGIRRARFSAAEPAVTQRAYGPYYAACIALNISSRKPCPWRGSRDRPFRAARGDDLERNIRCP